jgi:Plasmid encoded RepA protein
MTDDAKDRAIAVAEQIRARVANRRQTDKLTSAQRKLLEDSATIFGDPATIQDAAYLPRELVQVTLPHKNPGNIPVWRRTNGNITVGIEPGANLNTGESYGYPYGIIPRLLLFWITTEAVRTKSARLELGSSLSGFMADLGLSAYTGRGKRGDAKRLRNQMERLFWSRIRFLASDHGGEREAQSGMQVADETMFWWNPKDPDQATLWGSWIKLSERFFAAITAYPVPVDMRALKALKRSPLALDLYAWLSYEAYRAHSSGKPRFENWTQLHDHLGAEYQHRQHFRSATKAAIRKIKVVYPGLKLGDRQGGIQVLPESWPAIQPRRILINGNFKTI